MKPKKKPAPKRKTKKRVYDPVKARQELAKKSPTKYRKNGTAIPKIDTRPPDDDQYCAVQLRPYRTGRPTDYEPIFCEYLIMHMRNGLSFRSFAASVSTTKSTLYAWVQVHAEFQDAKEQGEELALYYWESLSKQTAKTNVGNFQAQRFNMINRFKDEWRDGHNIDLTTRGKEIQRNVNLSVLDTGTLRKLLEGEDNET